MNLLSPFCRSLLVSILLIVSQVIFSQTSNFIYFGIENGLPQSGIHNILQDKKGNLWLGTMDGVSKYNGQTFKNYNKDQGMAENWVTASLLDSKGDIWFGHWAGGISFYDQVKDTIINFNDKDISKSIIAICEDRSGNFWFGTEGMGIVKINATDKKLFFLNTKDGLSGNTVSSIICDKNGFLWIATDGGITKYNTTEKNIDKAIEQITVKDGLPSNDLTAILQDNNGTIWIGTKDKGLIKYDVNTKQVLNFRTENGLTNDNIKTMYEDSDKNIWIGTLGGGISYFNENQSINNNSLDQLTFKTFTTKEGLCNNKVLSVFQDREKNLWIGTFIGLNQLRTEHFEIYGAAQGLSNSLIWSIIKDKEGFLWMGTENGLMKYNPRRRESDQTIQTITNKEGLANNNIVALYEDNEGFIWASNWGAGVCRVNKADGKIEKFNTSNGLPSNDVSTIIGDKEGNIWIGTDKGGLAKYTIQTKTFELFTSANGIGNDRIYTSFRDKNNNLWFGTLGGGITKYNGKIFHTFSEKEGLSHTFVICIAEDREGNILAGTYGGGIYKFDGTSFSRFQINPSVRSFSPFLMFADKADNLWIGTNAEIDKYNFKTKKLQRYDKEEGFLGVEVNPNAVCADNEGNIWFGSVIGAVKYNPKKDKFNTFEPITAITGLQVFFKNTDFPADATFEYNHNQISFSFIGVSLTNPRNIRYQTKLVGFESDWSPIVKENFVTFNNLPPGSYSLLVRASNSDGVWNSKPISYSFKVLPPFWKKAWFFIVAGFLLVLSIYVIFRLRLRSIRNENKLLELKVEERTEELKQQNTELERLSIVASETDNGVLIFDSEYTIEWINAGLTRMTGYTLEEFKRTRGENLMVMSKNPLISKMIQQSIEERKSVQYETINKIKNGEEIWIQSNLTPIFDNEGKLKKMVAIEININERKKAEKIITEKNEELWKMSTMLMKQKEQVENQNAVIQQKNKDITDSIVYAKHIQDAILPQKKEIHQYSKDLFIFYQPRDIVSGDFYWFTKTEKNSNPVYIIAAADCTGHGVPGAFMSMIGHTLLNQIVHEKKIQTPAEILTLLDHLIKVSLKQDHIDASSWDGMDVALCSFEFDRDTKQIISMEYSGALRPLYHISDGVLEETHPNKYPIGGFLVDERKDFVNHKIIPKKGDTFYIFSDGYADQFGGVDGRKFMTRKLKNNLLAMQHLPMDEQEKELEREFIEWKGKQEQVDDIMVIGIRV